MNFGSDTSVDEATNTAMERPNCRGFVHAKDNKGFYKTNTPNDARTQMMHSGDVLYCHATYIKKTSDVGAH